MSKYEKNVYIAMLAEQCNRFEEMVEFLEDMLKGRSQDLNSDERNLLSIAYKNSVTSKRTALRTVMAYELKEKKKENSNFLVFIQEYRKKIEDELTATCNGVLRSIDNHLLPRAADDEAKVFYHKMKGDYNRYVAEYAQGDLKDSVATAASESYRLATESAKNLSPIHPIGLGLALNYSVFYYEVLNNHEKACEIAKETLDVAQKELPKCEETYYNDECRDAISIINLLRENLEMWKIEAEENTIE
jgi:14-3-3 protein epsilon